MRGVPNKARYLVQLAIGIGLAALYVIVIAVTLEPIEGRIPRLHIQAIGVPAVIIIPLLIDRWRHPPS